MTFWYLATPYSKYPGGIEAAFRVACEATGLLIKAKVPVFSPIAHTHPVSIACGMDPLDHTIWMPADRPMMVASQGIIMLMADSWHTSYGMGVEFEYFCERRKPVVWMEPGALPEEFR